MSAPTRRQTLAIDWTRCDGHGVCAALLPNRIVMDEWGFPILQRRDVASPDTKNVRRAVSLCPALALRLEPVHPDR